MSYVALILIALSAATVVRGQECFPAGKNSDEVEYCCYFVADGSASASGCTFKDDVTTIVKENCTLPCGEELLSALDFSSGIGELTSFVPTDEYAQNLTCVAEQIKSPWMQNTKKALLALADGNREDALGNLTETWGWSRFHRFRRGLRWRRPATCFADDQCGSGSFLMVAEELYKLATTGLAMSYLNREVATTPQQQITNMEARSVDDVSCAQATAHLRLKLALYCT